jgi:hypothetical protein
MIVSAHAHFATQSRAARRAKKGKRAEVKVATSKRGTRA